MASNVTVQSVLGNISQDHLKCSICSDRFKEPKVLDCLHSFCLKCLHELRQCQDQDASSAGLTCPLCRCETILKGNDVSELPNDSRLSALVEEVTIQEQLLEDQGSEIKCQNCDEGNKAVSRCRDCNSFLCLECEKAHRRMAVMKSHEVTVLAQLRSGEISYTSKTREEIPKCRQHPDQNLNVYCNTCEQLICTTCSVLDHARDSLIGLAEAFEKCKQDLAELTTKAGKKTQEWSITVTKASKTQRRLYNMLANTNKKISKTVHQRISRIKQEEKKLKEEAKRIYKDRLKTLETAEASAQNNLREAEQKLHKTNRLVAEASRYEVLGLKQKLVHNLQRVSSTELETVPDSLSFIDFEECERSLGRLVLHAKSESELQAQAKIPQRLEMLRPTGKWQLITELRRNPQNNDKITSGCDVSVFSNDTIVVVDNDNQQLISFLLQSSPHTPVITQAIYQYLCNPSHIAVNKNDHLIFLDDITVKICDREYQFIHEFQPGRSSGTNGKPTCLAVDDANLIAVGYTDNKEISLHNPDGTHIKMLAAPMIGDHLAIHKRRLFYTSRDCDKLLSLDYSGNMVFSVDNKARGQDYGSVCVCRDSEDSIYVAARGDDTLGEIHQYSLDGQFMECALMGCGTVISITFTPGGDLVLSADDAVKIYRRVYM